MMLQWNSNQMVIKLHLELLCYSNLNHFCREQEKISLDQYKIWPEWKKTFLCSSQLSGAERLRISISPVLAINMIVIVNEGGKWQQFVPCTINTIKRWSWNVNWQLLELESSIKVVTEWCSKLWRHFNRHHDNSTAHFRHQCRKNHCLKLPQMSNQYQCSKNEQNLNID